MPYSLYQRSHCPGRVAVVCSGQTPTCTTLPPPPPLPSLHSVNPPVRYTSIRPSPWGEPILFLLVKPYHFPIQIQTFLHLLLYHLSRNTLILAKEIILLVRGGGCGLISRPILLIWICFTHLSFLICRFWPQVDLRPGVMRSWSNCKWFGATFFFVTQLWSNTLTNFHNIWNEVTFSKD